MAHVYSFLNLQGALTGPGGVINLGNGSGAADEGITVAPAGELNTMTIGADGTGMHSLSADKSGKVTIRLLKTSPTNQLLSAMLAFQRTSAATHGQNTIMFADTVRGDAVVCRQCAFSKVPDLSYGKSAGFVEWQFDSVYVDITLGA